MRGNWQQNASKHRNVKTYGVAPDGTRRLYESQREAGYSFELFALARARDILSWEPQVSIRLLVNGAPLRPFGGQKDAFYRADFVIQVAEGETQVHEVKGRRDSKDPMARLWMLKLGILQAMHPDWKIVLI